MSLLIVEFEHRAAHFQAGGQAHELLPVRDAAELAVGDDLQAAVLLQADDIADRLVLRGAHLGLAEPLLGMRAKGLAQLLRAQQAADVIGTRRYT